MLTNSREKTIYKRDNILQESKDCEAQLETIIRDHRHRMPLDL